MGAGLNSDRAALGGAAFPYYIVTGARGDISSLYGLQPPGPEYCLIDHKMEVTSKTVVSDASKSLSFPLKTSLADGTSLLIRPLQPGDRKDLLEGFQKLSMGSRRFRFLTPIRKLSEYQLKSLIEVDQLNHVAIGVKDIGRPGKPGVAIARFVRLEEEPRVAEFAITVIDEYQNRGLGTLLTRILMEAAAERGIDVLRGFLLDDNLAMIRLLHRFGARMKRDSGNVLQADLAVEATSTSGKPT
jgi:RimJ/RimL family protein N-acetyltransferase